MASEAESAEGGFKQACVGVEHHGRYVAGWYGYRHGVDRGRIRRRMKDSTSVEIVEHDEMLGDGVGGASTAKPTLDKTTT